MTAPAGAERWIATFLEAQAAELDAARNTRLAYGRDLKDFAGWLAGRGAGFADVAADFIPLIVIAALTLPLTAWLFRNRLA